MKILGIAEDERTDAQKRHAALFSARGSNYLLVAAIGSCIETILGVAVADRHSLRFKKSLSPAQSTAAWQPVVDLAMAFSGQLVPATDRGLKAQDRVKTAIEDFSSMLEAVRSANPVPFDALAAATEKAEVSTRRAGACGRPATRSSTSARAVAGLVRVAGRL